ncbi:hypothetical protein [Piscinibacter sp. XHJ-5]|uniref:hypothetical protein n=1 Tax=Piscinibacter sp. XHJ-5 TaxID=3037797 RepID=UPI0024528642|nr:hypothetical protein [Piscinibacter sp. XHJ-5]
MATPLIPVKTSDGQAELSSRQRRLSQRHRTVLLLVDGRRTAEQVQTLARQAGASESCFGDLLELGLIVLPRPAESPGPLHASLQHVDIPLDAIESVLPAARTLQPESVLDDTLNSGHPSDVSRPTDFDALEAGADATLEEARGILIRALRAEAPVAGSLTLLRLRRARTRSELAELIDEVEARIMKPYRTLSAQQTLRHVRHLLIPRRDAVQPAS